MQVSELIAKLQAIEDKTIGVTFYCETCESFQSIVDMKQMGFVLSMETQQQDHKGAIQ